MRIFKKIFPFVLLLLISLPTIRDLLKSGGYTSHDLTHHIVRTIQMDKLLKEGQIPPRWAGELNYDYGYPIFLFMYPLPHFLATLVHWLGFNFVWSVKLVFLCSMLLSALFAFIFFRKLWQDRLAGFLSAIFYLYAPIRFVNVYISATLGNALGFLFIPLIFWAILKVAEGKKSPIWAILVGALNFAALVLSHNTLALIFAPVIASFAFLVFLKNRTWKFLKRLFLMFILGLGLACFFWLPVVMEKKYIRYDSILRGFYKSYFPAFWQLVRSPWGYGFDHPGTQHDAMPFQIGLTHILVIILTVSALVFYFTKLGNLAFFKKLFSGLHQATRKSLSLAIFFLCFFFLSIFFMQEMSIPIYEKIHYLEYIQHPWRLLALSVFCAASLAGFLVKVAPGFWRRMGFFVLFFLVLYSNRNHLRINQVFDPGEEFYHKIKATTTMAGEHLPEWAMQKTKEPENRIEILEGEAEIKMEKVISAKMQALIKVKEKAVLIINHFYFPGWQLLINGKEYPFEYRGEAVSRLGLPTFTLEKGEYQLEYLLKKTPVRQVADLVSFLAIVTWSVLFLGLLSKKVWRVR